MGCYAEFRHRDDQSGQWMRVGDWRDSVRLAKADARKHLSMHQHMADAVTYRIVLDDDRSTVETFSPFPHGKKMKWLDSRKWLESGMQATKGEADESQGQ